MADRKTGIKNSGGTTNFQGPVKNDLSSTTIHNYGSSNKIAAYCYPNATIHDKASKHHNDFSKSIKSVQTSIAETKSEPLPGRQAIIVIHGHIQSGKTTLAHLLMTDKDLNFENSIWINAETNETLEQNFRQLYKELKVLRDQQYNPEEELPILLKWVYQNLLITSTLIVFNNAAVFDLDPKSVYKTDYDLQTYLTPLPSMSKGKEFVTPVVVVTTRALSTCIESPSFSSVLYKIEDDISVIMDDDQIQKKLETDTNLIRKRGEVGKLASFLMSFISLFDGESPEEAFLSCCCEQTSISTLLNRSGVSENEVETALELLKDFSMVDIETGRVHMPGAVRIGAKKNLETGYFEVRDLYESIVLAIDSEAARQSKFASDMTAITTNLYSQVLKYRISASSNLLTFNIPGMSYEERHNSISTVLFRNFLYVPKDGFEIGVKITLEKKLIWIQMHLCGCTQTNMEFFQKYPAAIAVGQLMQGLASTSIEYLPLSESSSHTEFSLFKAERLLKLGNLSDSSKCIDVHGSPAHRSFQQPPDVLRAEILIAQGKHLLAVELLESKRICGPSSNYTEAAATQALAKLKALDGNFRCALELIDDVLRFRRQHQGVTTVRYIQACGIKAKILALQDYREALMLLRKVQMDFTTKIRYVYADGNVEDHPHFLILRYYEASLRCHQGHFDDSTENELQVLQSLFTSSNIYWFKCQHLRAKILQRNCDLQGSNALLKELRQQAMIHFEGSDNHHAFKFDLAYAENLLLRGKTTKAKKLAEEVLNKVSPDQSIKLRLRARKIIAQCDNTFVSTLVEIVQECTSWSGPFHVDTLMYKLNLAEAQLRIGASRATIEELFDPTMDHLSKEFGETSKLRLSWSLLDARKSLGFGQLKSATKMLSQLESLVFSERSTVNLQIQYLKAIQFAENGNFSEASALYRKVLEQTSTNKMCFPIADRFELTAFQTFLLMKRIGRAEVPRLEVAQVLNSCLVNLPCSKQTNDSESSQVLQAKINVATAYVISGETARARSLVREVEHADKFYRFRDMEILRSCLSSDIMDSDDLDMFVHSIRFGIGGQFTYDHENLRSDN